MEICFVYLYKICMYIFKIFVVDKKCIFLILYNIYIYLFKKKLALNYHDIFSNYIENLK